MLLLCFSLCSPLRCQRLNLEHFRFVSPLRYPFSGQRQLHSLTVKSELKILSNCLLQTCMARFRVLSSVRDRDLDKFFNSPTCAQHSGGEQPINHSWWFKLSAACAGTRPLLFHTTMGGTSLEKFQETWADCDAPATLTFSMFDKWKFASFVGKTSKCRLI